MAKECGTNRQPRKPGSKRPLGANEQKSTSHPGFTKRKIMGMPKNSKGYTQGRPRNP